MPTERLYYTDAYCSRFTATVVDASDGGTRVYLDRSAFYPTSGGQPFDLGTLGGVAVRDVVDEDDRVAHLLAAPLAPGTAVEGEVDWARRFDLMQQHTAQHLLSAIFADRYGWPTVSVHFGDESATLDLDVGQVDAAVLREAERQANAVVTENRPVVVSFEDAATATGLRKASERTGVLRIVSITGLDRSACGGTHVRHTGEIGVILLRKVERVKKQVRIEFLAGGRAVRRARQDQELLATLAAAFSAGADEVPALVEGQRAQLKEAEALRRALVEQLAGYRLRDLHAGAAPDAGGVRRIRYAAQPGDDLRALGQAATQLAGTVFLATSEAPPTILLATSADSGVDAGAVLKAALSAAGGRGGGSPRLAQGTVPDAAALAAVRAQVEGS
ncbi:MAG: alanyl-tRNA editing protein [Gemmatimonadetes bacterium]|nr:alanyl-tRNA editing protein [Gemmatimonadota bacterium]